MIKRPLIWILAAYLVGMYLAWLELVILVAIILIAFYYPMIYLFLYRFNNKFISKRDIFLWFLPVLLLLGFCSMKSQLAEPKLNDTFEQEISCELSGRISMIVNKQWGQALYVKNNTITLTEGESYVCEHVIIYCYDNNKNHNISISKQYLVGNQIVVRGTLQKFTQATNPGQFNEKLYYQIENIDFKMEADSVTVSDSGYSRFHACLNGIKSKLLITYEGLLPEKESGTLIAMLLGEKYLLDEDIKKLYQINGISHILAISGLHVSLIGMFIFFLLKKLRLPIPLATVISIFSIYSYGVLTNFSVSTNRAVVMMTVMLLAGLIGKTYDMLSSLALSALIILLQNPLQIFSAGFLLSFGAVLGIALIYPCLKKLFPSKNPVVSGLFISISAQVTTTPFIILYFYQLPTYSILINLIILPFVTVLTLTSIFAGIAGMIYLPLGIFLIGGANYILKFYEWVCRIGGSLPGNLITIGKPDVLWIILYLLMIIFFLWIANKYERKISVIILGVAFVILSLPSGNSGLEITMLDVGQGDAIYIESRSGTTYLIDGGSTDVNKVGNYRIQPFLFAKGTDILDYAVITHSDSDHISGLLEIIEAGRIKIKNLVLPYINNKDKAYTELEGLAQRHHIKIRYISTGDYIRDGGVQVLCLHPEQNYVAESSNAYSTVLSVSFGEFDMLLTGDLQQDGEEQVCDLLTKEAVWRKYFYNGDDKFKPLSDYDVLKVAHHGSKYSTSEAFLRLIRPELSLISCGRDNFYGHPHKELLKRLTNFKSEIMITYNTGAITIQTDGNKMKVSTYINGK